MRKFLSVSCAALIAISIAGYGNLSAEPWKKTLDLGLNLTQNAYSNSWTGGEIGNATWVANANGIFEKQISPKFNFKNSSKLQFGQTISQDKETKDWHHPVKSTDKIDIENLGRLTLHAFVDPYVAFRIETQFLDASVNKVNRYLNPLLLTESAGVSKTIYAKDKNQALTRLGFSVRQNIDRIVVDTLAKTLRTKIATDGGIESVSDAQFALSTNLSYVGKLSLFKALFNSKNDLYVGTPQENYWKAVHVNFENSVVASVAKNVMVSLYVQLLYDKQISLKGRFKQTLALGVTYKLI